MDKVLEFLKCGNSCLIPFLSERHILQFLLNLLSKTGNALKLSSILDRHFKDGIKEIIRENTDHHS